MHKDNTDLPLPLTEATLFILLSLASGPAHGYAIIKEVAELSQNRVRLSAGTLYGALARLLEQGWIERVEGSTTDTSGRERKEYKLTGTGKRVLRLEVERMQALVALADLRLAEDAP